MLSLKLFLNYRRPFVVALHLVLVVYSNYLAFWLRFDGQVPMEQWMLFAQMLPWLVAIRALTFMPFRLYEGLWRYTSIGDLRHIIGGVLASTLVFYGLVHWGLSLTIYPKSVFLVDSILLVSLLGGVRLARRIYRELGHPDRAKRILIYGAGGAGEMIVRDMNNNPYYEYEPIGFVDDDPAKTGRRIHGIKVFGTREDLPRILEEQKPHVVLVAIPRSEPAVVRKVVKALEHYKVPIKTVPSFRDILSGQVEVSQIRSLAIEDLLERTPVGLDHAPVRSLVAGKRVLVTGAGGSIGSELCWQIASFQPSALILYERYENGLYAVSGELAAHKFHCPIHACIGDVTDVSRVNAVMQEHRPDIIFHAAAHKHVPLMETNPCEAVKNNIFGTRIMIDAARRYDAERFILISTDKAVNPSSVMGASKRVAEFLVQDMKHSGKCVYSVVRFGNVLGSNGSVVPRFLDQIKAGGPVTVTHPEMRRYFMLIPEAVQLVLHAGALAKSGEIFVLEMGEQIKVLDMARNLIRLSGFVPEEEIPIVFTGVRPGEKLYEELVEKDEIAEPSRVENIRQVSARRVVDPVFLTRKIEELELLASMGNAKSVLDVLCELVPTYTRG